MKILCVRVQDIVNTFWHEFYLVEGSRHRELDQGASVRKFGSEPCHGFGNIIGTVFA